MSKTKIADLLSRQRQEWTVTSAVGMLVMAAFVAAWLKVVF